MDRRAGLFTRAALLVVTVGAWAGVIGRAPGPGGMGDVPAPPVPGLAEGAAYVAAWTVMMAAMMLPGALPMIALYAATWRGRARAPVVALAVTQFTLVYLALWAASGVPIYVTGRALAAVPGVATYGAAAALVAAGLYQFTPLKRTCLRACRSPLGFLLGRWRPGWRGTLGLAWAHALHCLGCCWALMVVLVAAGAMGLAWVLLIAALVAAEKLAPRGEALARLTGVALVLLGLAVLARPDLAVVLRAGGHAM